MRAADIPVRIGWLLTKPGYSRHALSRALSLSGLDVVLRAAGYDDEHWMRKVYVEDWRRVLRSLPVTEMDALEISPGKRSHWRDFAWRAYEAVDYPAFDICAQSTGRSYDLIIAEQVFEHLRHPYRAARNALAMLRPGGLFMIATPFLLRIHGHPGDYTRWTPQGMEAFLEDCGFTGIDVRSWGNRACARANFLHWANYGWCRSLRNEPDFAVAVWAYAQREGAR
jgi:SAM-dependent methyltransferase